jgi:uncharacterized phage-associated protein
MPTVAVEDVAEFILTRMGGELPAMKLQKLVYYSQAWALVWDDGPLFEEPIQAWVNGPVVPALYAKHSGKYAVKAGTLGGDPTKLTENASETISTVLAFYGAHNSQWLSDLTHAEDPWRNARRGHSPTERGTTVITHAAMCEYYSSLSG